MPNTPGRDGDDIVTHLAIGKAGVAGDEHVCGPFDPATGLRRHSAGRIIERSAAFHFDEDDDAVPPSDEIDLAAMGAVTARQNAVAFELQKKAGGPFGSPAEPLRSTPRRLFVRCSRRHGFSPGAALSRRARARS